MTSPANDVRDRITIAGVVVRRLNSGRIDFEGVNGTTIHAESNVPLTALYEKLKKAAA